jgi:hypothetical protein
MKGGCDGLAVELIEVYMYYKLSQWTLAHAVDKGQLIYSVEWTAIAGVVSAHVSLELDVRLAADMLDLLSHAWNVLWCQVGGFEGLVVVGSRV